MLQMDRPKKRESPKSPTSPTMEQLLRDSEGPWLSAAPSEPRNRDPEEDHCHGHPQKKSVLTKVKEKAKKLRHSLSGKRRTNEDHENATPAWGVSLEDDEDEEEDAEYLGAPMYESELAPESYKETARKHPRAIPAISEKHVLPPENDKKNEKPLSPTDTEPTQTQTDHHNKLSGSLQQTMTETVSQKLSPALETMAATVSGATQSIASKIQGLSLNSTTETSQTNNSNINKSSPVAPQTTFSSEAGKNVSSGGDQRMWDKGVSMKEYLLNKFEPGEEDRELSRTISEAISPRARKAAGDQMSVVDKVREAVTSLLRNEPTRSSPPQPMVLTRSPTKASSRSSVLFSANAGEVVEEKNHGRVLQTN